MELNSSKRGLKILKRSLMVLFIGVFGFFAWFVWMLWRHEDLGGEPPFAFDPALSIEKISPNGIKYTVNNSMANFSLDVTGDDRHSGRLFPDYASALKYCASSKLRATL